LPAKGSVDPTQATPETRQRRLHRAKRERSKFVCIEGADKLEVLRLKMWVRIKITKSFGSDLPEYLMP
jgi:hypothetical protein